ncbi:MAG: phosphate starvation-inducible protein PhoH [Limnobacter sp. CACIAM 66H1]|uniref:PhoH family protein n=1 Tax=Limnobacter sp. CACIAM 66H1 TaxID=1813033 RepID=UPI0007A7F14A|nr:PhoH family protein [Limnobacter sp. CACIAM 66H1]KYP10526.1 MAG: phosphate starvation-inducible protein PhoH [Limnobacter sp. CACIAM 66H1]
MPLPKEPSKPATTLNEIPPIAAPKTKKPAKKIDVPDTINATAKAPLTLAADNTVTAKVPSTSRSRNLPAAASGKTRKPVATPMAKTKRQVTHTGKKIFVLDTNVLMHDPTSLFRFEEHDVFLPLITLEELDNHKKGMSEVARHARQVSRSLDALMENIEDIEKGVALDRLGNVDALGRLLVQTTELAAELPKTLPVGKADNQILGVVFALSKQHPDREVALVSKDINMRIKARALGLLAEDYFNDQVLEDRDLLYSGIMELPADFWEKNSKGIESWQQGGSTFYRISGPAVKDMMVNQFVYCETGIPLIAQVLEVSGRSAVLKTLRDFSHNKNSVWGITARNREQNFALNLLMNPECDFVTLLGQAGTGKTLLALAAGLSQVLESKQYSEIIVTRATVPVGEDIGFLPGTEEEKMAPWMGAFEDNLEVLNKPDPSSGDWGRSATTDLIRTKIRIKSMNFMRGRTFINKFLIIDEAQNLSPKQMKTLITRAGPGTKVICLGNLAQIDTPYLTEGSSGLTYVVDRFKGWTHAGHITLQRGERSRLADFASDNL